MSADQPVLLAASRPANQAGRDGPCLLIGNPAGAGLATGAATHHAGYACRFTEAFFKARSPVVNSAQWALLSNPAPRVFALGREQAAYLNDLFAKMLVEQQATYIFKQELLGAYLNLVLHEAMRLRTSTRLFHYYCRLVGTQCELRMARRC
ncbi:hypothetical protein HHL22_12345 [Hymenobacter sp. RP-2-7]|uniref:Uncharacterized protein n=1 Tax=Hymenobacter polaris TaxID=2682546 RepID=A0A7Y0AER1_9BACT|nr:hypothetical protein [Hymenobacter polaris]NML65995.1 hypothetical protein [Hymenobacter polaris]